jgi:hypothetical protein
MPVSKIAHYEATAVDLDSKDKDRTWTLSIRTHQGQVSVHLSRSVLEGLVEQGTLKLGAVVPHIPSVSDD